MDIIERSVQEIGKSLLVSLPKGWATSLNIKKGSKLRLMVSDRGTLMIAPEFVAAKQHRTATVVYDEHFPRRFFREYFDENERITIKDIPKSRRQDVYTFLRRFMNAQIIEDDAARIVVKCFRIEELSIDECLSRMFYISLNMLKEHQADKIQLQEMRDTMTRFYYMLVMQIRRYLSEGKYTNAKEVSLLRAMDLRMVAEKIQRIGALAMTMPQSPQLPVVVAFYQDAYNYFASGNYEKALALWQKSKALARNVKEPELLDIIAYAKEISMLVR